MPEIKEAVMAGGSIFGFLHGLPDLVPDGTYVHIRPEEIIAWNHRKVEVDFWGVVYMDLGGRLWDPYNSPDGHKFEAFTG